MCSDEDPETRGGTEYEPEQGGPEYEYEKHMAQMERAEEDQDRADADQERRGDAMLGTEDEGTEQGPLCVMVERNIMRRRSARGRYTYRAEVVINGVRYQRSGIATLGDARDAVALWRAEHGPTKRGGAQAATVSVSASFLARLWVALRKGGTS